MKKTLSAELATRQNSADYYALGMMLPNPDPVLKALGQDIKVYRELRSDAHVGGCVRRRKGAVKALEWGLDKDDVAASVIAHIEQWLNRLNVSRIVTEMMDAVFYGYQPMEVIWGKQDGLLLPVAVVGKPPEWFVFDEYNQLRMRTKNDPLNGELLPPRKFLLPRQDPSYDNPYGIADLARCFWPTTFKKGGLKFWVTFTEKYGSPWIIGKQPRSASPAETNTLLDSLDDMVQDAVGVIPDDSSVDIKEAAGKTGSAEVYERLLTFCRGEVAIALLGQNQTTEASSNRASAQAGLEVTDDIRDSDAAIVIEAMNQLIDWVCELNFGEGARPRFNMWEQESVDKLQAERDQVLTNAGAKLTKAYFMRTYNLADDEVDVSAATSPPPPNLPPEPASFAEEVGAPSAPEQQLPTLEEEAAPLVGSWLARIGRLVGKVDTLPELQDQLLAEFSELDADELADVMALAYSAAELAGRSEVADAGR